MRQQTKLIILSAFSVAVLAALVVIALNLAVDVPDDPEPTVERGPGLQPTVAVSSKGGCTFRQDQLLGYRIRQSVRGRLEFGGLALGMASKERKTFAQQTSAMLHLQVLRTQPAGAVVLARFNQVTSDAKVDLTGIERPFLLRIDPRCQIIGFARHVDTNATLARVQQAWAHELQWRWPLRDKSTGAGENANGRYLATFAFSARQGSTTVQRRIDRYKTLWGRSQFNATPDDALLTVRMSDGAWFDSLASYEKLQGHGGVYLEARVAAKHVQPSAKAFRRTDQNQAQYQWGSWLDRVVAVQPVAEAPVTESRRKLLARLRAVSPTQAVNRYVQQIEAGATIANSWPGLRDYMEARPAAAREVVDKLKSGEIPRHASGPVYIALGNTRTPQARAELLSMFRSHATPVMSRTRAMFALVDRDDVGAELAQEISQSTSNLTGGDRHSRFFAREAALALGAMAGLKGRADVKRIAVATAGNLLARAGVDNLAYLRPAVGLIANIGDPGLLKSVVPYAESPNIEVRNVATRAIRRMHPKDTEAFVVSWLKRETSPLVRQSLYKIMERQVHDARTVIGAPIIAQSIGHLKAGPDRITRKSIIRLLGRAAKTSPAAKQALLDQVPIELAKRNFGVYKSMVRHLEPDELRAALAKFSGTQPRQGSLSDAF